MYMVDAVTAVDSSCIVDKQTAENFLGDLLKRVPYAPGINNKFFIEQLDPKAAPPSIAKLQILLQNWLEQKRILRAALVKGLEATVVAEFWPGQIAYLDLLQDEIQGRHVDLCWESLKQPALVAGLELPHSVDSQDSELITDEMKDLRYWQATELNKEYVALVAVAIFEHQSQPVLRRTYQALNAWYGDKLSPSQRQSFERYFAVHTSISDISNESTFEDIVINIPKNNGVEEKHAQVAAFCFTGAKKRITTDDLQWVERVFDLVNEKQNRAWMSVYQKCAHA